VPRAEGPHAEGPHAEDKLCAVGALSGSQPPSTSSLDGPGNGREPGTSPPLSEQRGGDRAKGVLHLSTLLGTAVTGPAGREAGRLADVIARLEGPASAGGHPGVTGLVVEVDGKDRFAHSYQVVSLGAGGALLSSEPEALGLFERRPGEVLLGRDLRSRHLIHLEGARLVRANEIELASTGTGWQVVGVDTSRRPVFRRALPRPLRHRVRAGAVVDWAYVEPFVAHVPTARLQIPFRKLRRLHPAVLADLVEAASHDEGEELIRAVGADRELEADVFEELDTEHQLEFLRSRSDDEAAAVLSAMAPDDAVDLLAELDQDRRLPILQRVSPGAQAKLRQLLSYNPETAGGLMNPDCVIVPSSSTVSSALDAVRTSPSPPEAASVVFVTDDEGRLEGTALVVDLIRADPSADLAAVMRPGPASLPPDADVHEVVRKMSDYNLAVAPVVDTQGRVLGQITVDDVLELLLPSGWRRQYGMASPE